MFRDQRQNVVGCFGGRRIRWGHPISAYSDPRLDVTQPRQTSSLLSMRVRRRKPHDPTARGKGGCRGSRVNTPAVLIQRDPAEHRFTETLGGNVSTRDCRLVVRLQYESIEVCRCVRICEEQVIPDAVDNVGRRMYMTVEHCRNRSPRRGLQYGR